EVVLELVSIRLTRDGGCRGSSPDAAVSRLTVRASHGMQHSGDQLLVFELALKLILFISGHADVNPDVIIAGFLNPEGCIAVGGLAHRIGCDITDDIDGKEPVFLVPLVPSADFLGGQTGGDSPGTTVSGPDRRHLEALALGIGTEPHGAISRFAERLG